MMYLVFVLGLFVMFFSCFFRLSDVNCVSKITVFGKPTVVWCVGFFSCLVSLYFG
jgi:hypothetical protein